MRLILGDCLDKLKELDDNSVDSIVTDPPYGLSFMGKSWDYEVPKKEIWIEALRVLKPGGHMLAFFGTRTYHRGVVNIEDAGFEIRDQIMWIYGSGFPKSHNIKEGDFKGWGTALKPANEPIVVARKPLEKGLTIAENVMKWGTGTLNIDASRIGVDGGTCRDGKANKSNDLGWENMKGHGIKELNQGRWPANVLFDEDAASLLDEKSGILKSGQIKKEYYNGKNKTKFSGETFLDKKTFVHVNNETPQNQGGASRFFYVAKASKSERNKGLEEMPSKDTHRYGAGLGEGLDPKAPSSDKNFHPTVKPIKLMEYLIRLVTPPCGIVLDPFMGSGSTGVAAKNLGFEFIGIEMNEEYFKIAEKRINHVG